MKYIEKFGGYLADNPNIEFETCGGEVYSYDEVNTASMTNSSETLEITGGQGNFPLAILDTTKTLEFVFESSEFTLDMFAMANDTKSEHKTDYAVQTSKRFEVETGAKIVINENIETDSIYIRGFEKGDTATTGKYTVTTAENATTITFATADVAVGDVVRVAYKRVIDGGADVVSVTTKSHTVKGSLTATWPIYSSGTDCSESSIKALLHVYIPRVRATALPGFDSSYKTAATQGITFTALDPKRADEKMFDVIWEDLSED